LFKILPNGILYIFLCPKFANWNCSSFAPLNRWHFAQFKFHKKPLFQIFILCDLLSNRYFAKFAKCDLVCNSLRGGQFPSNSTMSKVGQIYLIKNTVHRDCFNVITLGQKKANISYSFTVFVSSSFWSKVLCEKLSMFTYHQKSHTFEFAISKIRSNDLLTLIEYEGKWNQKITSDSSHHKKWPYSFP
jgi:hypothetical protein